MRNLKVSAKLTVSFLVVIVMAVVVGGVGILGMYRINAADDAMYEGNYLPSVMAGDISQYVVEQRVYMRNFVIYDVNEDAEEFKDAENNMAASRKTMDERLDEYDRTIVSPEDRAAYNEFMNVYRNEWITTMDNIQALGTANKMDEAKVALTSASAVAGKMNDLSTKLQDINMADGKAAVDANTDLFVTMTVIEAIVLILAVVVSLLLSFLVSKSIKIPLGVLTTFMNRASSTGDIVLGKEDQELIATYGQNKDETGQCISSTAKFVGHIATISHELEAVANGDLSIDIALLSERDTMGISVKKMVDNLNNMFSDINSASNQVSTGSVQIADGAQLLAQGATEQSATVEQLSASVAEVSEQTKHNADMAGDAKELGESIKASAEQGSNQMEQMMNAVKEINEASHSIGKVIKIIDDIAFQTNILALNAAVEAARAGQHGKGFAVVADEVRSLAAKSAEAAKNTNELIESSIKKAEQGAAISAETSESLQKIVEGILRTSELISDISQSSNEQSLAISQIGEAINQVSQVVQQNSATAEESAAASEEMSGQATLLQQLIAQFKLRDGVSSMSHAGVSAPPPSVSAPVSSIDSGETGFSMSGSKY